MGNSLRCCLACVIPCGALDVIRIVHLNGHVEEITRPIISAREVLEANPNHVLSKPCSEGVVRRILILLPESDLKRGNIYFLIPNSSLPENKRGTSNNKKKSSSKKVTTTTTLVRDHDDPHLFDILSENKSTSSRKDRRSNRVIVWRPHLESITEDL
ncbi:6,7-dimethyl-8-ribityllumazine synthase [Thalictrum thalictroides]|uniref:6,7-dimethyl-8-ribityllumazine synthase n=1 Tax=Thalictrum thalictroides TaxID=46969 RepID=A0A7J6WD10_THATH|nr:6,7-dimethyl-8-ribityllumazine synthase [Thalictrum thalictroides]